MLIEVEEKVANLIKKLRIQAAERQIPFDAYLELVAEAGDATSKNGDFSVAEFEKLLDELADGLPHLPPLPLDFGRADIYSNHD